MLNEGQTLHLWPQCMWPLSDGLHIQQGITGHACATFRESRPTGSSSIMHTQKNTKNPFDLDLYTQYASRGCWGACSIVRAKLHQAKISSSRVIMFTEKQYNSAMMPKTILPSLSHAVTSDRITDPCCAAEFGLLWSIAQLIEHVFHVRGSGCSRFITDWLCTNWLQCVHLHQHSPIIHDTQRSRSTQPPIPVG